MGKVNITDVARRAGVSRKTVSRVLNDEAYVSDGVRKKVESVISELNYEPDRQARSLRTGKSYQLGFIYQSPSSYFVISLIEGIRATCKKEGYELIQHETEETGSRLLLTTMEFIERSRLDGVILMPPLTDNDQLLETLTNSKIMFSRVTPGSLHSFPGDVHTTNREAGAEMTNHLLSLGHERIAFISGDPDHLAMEDRMHGVRDSIQQWTKHNCSLIIRQGFNTFESGQKIASALLTSEHRPTAIFAANDDMAAGVMFEAQERGFRVPDELTVAGFDDTPLAARIWPGLTTVAQPTFDLGMKAAKNVIDLVKSRDVAFSKPIPTRIIIRRSSGRARVIEDGPVD